MALTEANAVKILVMPTVVAGLIAGCASTDHHRPLSREEFEGTDFTAIVPERWWGAAATSGTTARRPSDEGGHVMDNKTAYPHHTAQGAKTDETTIT